MSADEAALFLTKSLAGICLAVIILFDIGTAASL